MSVNKVMVLGRLGQDPELKYLSSGTPVCNFSVATSDHWMDKSGQRQERTEWHRIVVWGKVGENCKQYLSKGRQVFVEGSLQTRSWETKEGQKRYTTEIVARNVQFIGSGGGEARSSATRGAQANGLESPGANNSDEMSGNTALASPNINTDSNFTADDIPF